MIIELNAQRFKKYSQYKGTRGPIGNTVELVEKVLFSHPKIIFP
jgi:hypothetical protein